MSTFSFKRFLSVFFLACLVSSNFFFFYSYLEVNRFPSHLAPAIPELPTFWPHSLLYSLIHLLNPVWMQTIGTVWEDDLYLKIAEGVRVDLGAFPSLLGWGYYSVRFFFHGYHLNKVMLLSIYLLEIHPAWDGCCQSSPSEWNQSEKLIQLKHYDFFPGTNSPGSLAYN